jgi:hypothetical protein
MQNLQLENEILKAKLSKCIKILKQIDIIKGLDNMIIKDKTNLKVEKDKAVFGITGDVYLVNHCMESLESHKVYMQQNGEISNATTIEEAEQERIEIDERLRQLALERAEQEEEMVS